MSRLPPKSTVRCMWFDDDKQPIKGGCKNPSGCDFTHPDSREWGSATRGRMATDRPRPRHERAPTPPALRSRREEMSKRRDSSGSFNSSSRGGGRDDRRKDTHDFNESSWDVPSTSLKGKAPERTSTWSADASSTGWVSPPKTSGSFDAGGGWGSSSGWGTSGGWGDGEGSSGWGSGSGWGASDSTGDKEKDTGAWGSASTTSGWNATDAGSSSTSGWNTGATTSGGRGSGPTWTEWSKAPSTANPSSTETNKPAEIQGKLPNIAPQTNRKPVTIQFGHSRQSSTDDSLPTPDPRKAVSFAVPPLPDRASAENIGKGRGLANPPELSVDTQSQPSPASGSSRDPRRGGSKTNTPLMGPPGPPSSKMPPTPSSMLTGGTSRELLSQAKAIKRRAMVPEDKRPKVSILQAKLTAEERAEVYKKTIRYIQELVCIQVKLNKMKTVEQNWKRNQNSNFYANSSQLARDKLTAGREDVAKGIAELKKEREVAIRDLVALPAIPTKPFRPYNPMADRQKLVDYTQELKVWIEGLDIPKRVAALQIKEVQPSQPQPQKGNVSPSNSSAAGSVETSSDTMVVDNPEADGKPRIAEQLRSKPHVSIADINKALDSLQNGVALSWDKVMFEAYTQEEFDSALNDIRARVTEMLQERRSKALKSQKQKLRAAMDEHEKAKGELSKALEQQTSLGEAVHARIGAVQDNVEEIKRKTAELNRLNDELEPLVLAEEQRQGRKNETIENLTNQVQTLMARGAHAKPRKVRPYTIEDLPLEFRQTIVNEVIEEVQPVLEGLLAGTSRAGEELKVALEKVIEPLLEKTAVITKAVKSLPTSSDS